jgi:hypothetical protein
MLTFGAFQGQGFIIKQLLRFKRIFKTKRAYIVDVV